MSAPDSPPTYDRIAEAAAFREAVRAREELALPAALALAWGVWTNAAAEAWWRSGIAGGLAGSPALARSAAAADRAELLAWEQEGAARERLHSMIPTTHT